MDTNDLNPYIDISLVQTDSTEDLQAYSVSAGTEIRPINETMPFKVGGTSTKPPSEPGALERTASVAPTYDVPRVITVKKYRLYKKG